MLSLDNYNVAKIREVIFGLDQRIVLCEVRDVLSPPLPSDVSSKWIGSSQDTSMSPPPRPQALSACDPDNASLEELYPVLLGAGLVPYEYLCVAAIRVV